MDTLAHDETEEASEQGEMIMETDKSRGQGMDEDDDEDD